MSSDQREQHALASAEKRERVALMPSRPPLQPDGEDDDPGLDDRAAASGTPLASSV